MPELNCEPETFEKRPLSKSALICPISALHSSRLGGTRNIQYIPVVKILMCLDLESRQGGKHFSKVSIGELVNNREKDFSVFHEEEK